MKSKRRVISFLTAIALSTTVILGSGIRTKAQEDIVSKLKSQLLNSIQKSQVGAVDYSKGKNSFGKELNENGKKLDMNEELRVIVQLKDSPAIKSESNGYTSSIKTEESNVKSSQKDTISQVEKITGTSVKRSFGYLVNGFSISTQRKNIEKIKTLPGVKSVTEVNVYYPDMAYAKNITGANKVWKDLGLKGEGMLVSIIDTGIDYRHKDLSNIKEDKIKLNSSKVASEIEKLNHGKFFTNKIPYGYNYADNNMDIIDVGAGDEHGMHVAGIVGANGNDKDSEDLSAVQGVAPEAQLLAMKVFSNNPKLKGAYDDDVIAAIEDSVKLGADVINMSLGSEAGFTDPDSPQAVAIKNATDNGVICVISAGNSQVATTINHWNQPANLIGLTDTSLVGSPSTAIDSLSVASMENSNSTAPAMSYESTKGYKGMSQFISVSGSNLDLLKMNHRLVYCGIGDEGGFNGNDVNGKIALIIRGDLSFSDKYANAVKNGAAGVIIYNHKTGGEAPLSMQVDNVKSNVPVFSFGFSAGEKIKSLISMGDDTFKFNVNGALSEENIDKDDMSQYTSWGPTSSLDFKPEITAPGGDIYSLANNNSYQSMSGTSMAAPHTAGAQALIIQGIKNSGLNLSGRELVSYAKNTAMNTARPMIDKYGNGSIPYSPRRQGAGLLQIEDAIKNRVSATSSNGQASLALKEVGNETKFTLTLTNYSSEAATYYLSDEKVYSETVSRSGEIKEVELNGAKIKFDGSSVKVPSNGKVNVTGTLVINSAIAKQKFVEGYIHLASDDVNKPSLVVPYMGFYGDWSKESIVDEPNYTDSNNSIIGVTGLLTSTMKGLGYLGGEIQDDELFINKSKVAFSPNGDGIQDDVIPVLYMLRNSKELKVQVVDKDGTVIRDLSIESNVRRNTLETYIGGTEDPKLVGAAQWDGKVYNSSTGKYENVKDGDYYIRVVNSVDLPDAKKQNLDMPIKVDTVAPEVKIIGVERSVDAKGKSHYFLKWNATDQGSGLSNKFNLAIGDKILSLDESNTITDGNGGYYSEIPFDESLVNAITIVAIDNAGNFAVDQDQIRGANNNSIVSFINLFDGLVINGDVVADGKYVVQGSVNDNVSTLEINNEEVKIVGKKFIYALKVEDGINEVSINAKDSRGKVLVDEKWRILVDVDGPEINISPNIGDTSPYFVTEEDNLKIKVSIKDDNAVARAAIMDTTGEYYEDLQLDANGSCDVTLPLVNGLNVFQIIALDIAGNYSVKELAISKQSKDAELQVKFNNLQPFSIISGVSAVNDIYEITGILTNKPKEFKIDGKDVKVNEDLTFSFKQKLSQGTNRIKVYAVDKNNNVVCNDVYRVIYDSKAPNIKFNLPKIRPDGKIYTNQDNFTVSGKVTDNLYGYSLYINGDAVLSVDRYPNEGEELLSKDFSKVITLKNGENTILAEAVDQFGNKVSENLQVVLDKEAPLKPTITLSNKELGNKPVDITITTNESNIDNIEYSFDGVNYLVYTGKLTTDKSTKVYARVTDYAGNVSEIAEAEVNIDTIAPKVNIKNITNGQVYYEPVTPEFEVDDKEATLTLFLNGKPYSGEEIDVAGEYILSAYGVDKAGNKSQVEEKKFTIAQKSYEEVIDGKTIISNNTVKSPSDDYVFTATTSDNLEVKLSTAVLTEVNKYISVNSSIVRTKLDKGILSLGNSEDLSFIQRIYGDNTLLSSLKSVGKIYDLSLLSSKRITDLKNNKAQVSVVLDKEELQGLNTGKLAAYYYDENAKEWKAIDGGSFNNNTSIFTFNAENLGKFTIAEKPSQDNGNSDNSVKTDSTGGTFVKSGDNSSGVVFMLFMIMAISGTVILVAKKRKKIEE